MLDPPAGAPGDPPEPGIAPAHDSYPARWESDVVLADGGTAHVRPIRPGDVGRLEAFHERQSPESIYFRFFSPRPKLTPEDLERFTTIDYRDRMAFVALLGDDIIGWGSFDRGRFRREAELSFITDDRHQGRGVATVLLEYLLVAGREAGMSGLTAVVLPSNQRMLSVLRSAGFQTRSEFADGLIEVSFELEPNTQELEAIEERARLAEARSVERLLSPSSIAVVGASRDEGTIGNELLSLVLSHGFRGTVYPVNPSSDSVAGMRSYRSVLDIDGEVDLALVAVPALSVLDVVEACGRKGVGALLVISAGFDAYGPYGHAGMRMIVERAHRFGMRVIGPESLGLLNTAPTVSLHATFVDLDVRPGAVGFLTQSGTLGIAALEHAHRIGLGISTFVDIGSKVDVSGNDLLQYWEGDPRTEVIALYLESFGNPRKFTRLARRVARSKPIVAVKSENTPVRTAKGADRGGLDDWPVEATTDALLRQSGVIRVESPIEMFDVSRLLAQQPVPEGHRVAIVSNSHGALALTVDACVGAGLELAELSDLTCGLMSAAGLPPGASRQNPVDLTFAASPELYDAAVGAVLDDDGVDALLVIYAPSFPRQPAEVARAIGAAASQRSAKPIVATFLGAGDERTLRAGGRAIPLFEFPAEAVRALARTAAYASWRRQPEGSYPSASDLPGLDLGSARQLVRRAVRALGGSGWLVGDSASELLDAIGLPLHSARLVRSASEALRAASDLGYPVALKATGLLALRPGEEGGAALSIHTAEELRSCYGRMADRYGEAFRPALVQSMVSGVEVQVAAHQHASFGAVLSLGLGGPAKGAAVDAAVRVLPLSDLDAESLIATSPVAPMLPAEPTADAEQISAELASYVLRLATVVDAIPELADVVLNPLSLGAEGLCLLDARIRVAPYRWADSGPAVRRIG